MKSSTRLIILGCVILFAPEFVSAQFQFNTKKLLEDYSLELFESNAEAYMGPLVIVSNVGANDGFYHSAYVPKEDKLHFRFTVATMSAWVRDDQKTYTAHLPLAINPTDDINVRIFKLALDSAVKAGELVPNVLTSTVFGGEGSGFGIPKNFILGLNIPGLDSAALAGVPDELPLTRGTNQKFVFAAVPQLEIGTFMNTQFLIRYIPPVEFDTAVGDFSFTGVALKHGFTNWIKDVPFDAAVQVSYQHSTINNKVGDTQAELAATTDMFSINVHASRRFGYVEPYMGVSYEHLSSKGTYKFVLPKRLSTQLGYDIDPQTAHISLSDDAMKLTLGVTGHLDPVELNIGVGISKHVILGAGLSVKFDPPFLYGNE